MDKEAGLAPAHAAAAVKYVGEKVVVKR